MPPVEDDDERPRRKPRRRDDDDDDYDDEDDRPRRSKKKQGDGTGGVIPYKNGMALGAYYCGIFSLIPGIGCVLGLVAVILGILGYMHANKHPEAKGKTHAIVGILFGMFGQAAILGLLYVVMAVANSR